MPGSKSGRYTFPGDFVPAAPDRGHTLKALGFHHSILKTFDWTRVSVSVKSSRLMI